MRPRYRICWEIDGKTGHGDWHRSRDGLNASVTAMNEKYGPGTHLVEVDPPAKGEE